MYAAARCDASLPAHGVRAQRRASAFRVYEPTEVVTIWYIKLFTLSVHHGRCPLCVPGRTTCDEVSSGSPPLCGHV
jgi:hypothetical protein